MEAVGICEKKKLIKNLKLILIHSSREHQYCRMGDSAFTLKIFQVKLCKENLYNP